MVITYSRSHHTSKNAPAVLNTRLGLQATGYMTVAVTYSAAKHLRFGDICNDHGMAN